ncbi:MAG TPA: hypothetical protein VNO21_27800 [Polyangiaceae bacterium]|nr:hypothetical protein [Polyangiaceae bacterium]
MMPNCACTARTRQQALETMQTLVNQALREERVGSMRYEIVYLAVGEAR